MFLLFDDMYTAANIYIYKLTLSFYTSMSSYSSKAQHVPGAYAEWQIEKNRRYEALALLQTYQKHDVTKHIVESEIEKMKFERNHLLNLIEEHILAVLELFDRKMCLNRGVAYYVKERHYCGIATGDRQKIVPDDALYDAVMTPEFAQAQLLQLSNECEHWEFQDTFVQRVQAYLIAKIKEVDDAIQDDAIQNQCAPPFCHVDRRTGHVIARDKKILSTMQTVYKEQLQIYAKIAEQRVRMASYKKRDVHPPHNKDEFGDYLDERKDENFLTSRPDFWPR